MRVPRYLSAVALICGGMLLPAASFAHHSFAAELDGKNCRDFTGILTKLDWQNPHPYFYVDVKDASGKVENWSFQTYAPITLQEKRHRPAAVSRQHRQRSVGQRMSRQERQVEHGRGRHAEIFGWRAAPGRPASGLARRQ